MSARPSPMRGQEYRSDYRTVTKQTDLRRRSELLHRRLVYLDRALQLAKDNSALLKTSSISALC